MRASNGGGVVRLRGIEVEIDGAVGQAFVVDCVRHIEDLVSADALKAKYALSDESWQALGANEKLQLAVGAQKERRVRDGSAARERAQALFLAAPDVLSTIVNDSSMSPRHRIDACRELRATAAAGSEADSPAAEKERFVIRIDFGTAKIMKEVELKPKAEHEPLTIEHENDDEDCHWQASGLDCSRRSCRRSRGSQ
jgi:hypothetical protein